MTRKYTKRQTDWLTPNQLKQYIGLSRATIMKYILNGQLKAKNTAIKAKRPYWKIHKSWADEFLAEMKPDNII